VSAAVTHDPLVVNTRDGVCWERRAVTADGRGLYAVEGSCRCPEFVMATLAELAEHGIVGSARVLPVPVGPEPRSELERLAEQVVELQGLLEQAGRDTARARRERDLIRERVSEPYGCTHCGEAKRVHGRRYIATAGVHSWERPSDEQVKDRMLARRAARFTSHAGRMAELLVARTEELLAAEARIGALESERHSTNESLDDAIKALRKREKQDAIVAEFVAARAEYVTALRNCHGDNTHDYDRWQGHAAARRQLSELLGLPVAWPVEDAAAVKKSAEKLAALLAESGGAE